MGFKTKHTEKTFGFSSPEQNWGSDRDVKWSNAASSDCSGGKVWCKSGEYTGCVEPHKCNDADMIRKPTKGGFGKRKAAPKRAAARKGRRTLSRDTSPRPQFGVGKKSYSASGSGCGCGN